jgi:hypothetical protein
MNITRLKLYLYLVSSLFLSACGGSSNKGEETTYPDAYLQFYNGSANSGLTYMRVVNGKALGSAAYGKASSLATVTSGEQNLAFYRIDSDGKEVLVEELQTTLQQGEKALVVASGEDTAVDFSVHKFARQELTDKFRLFGSSVISSALQYDLYMAEVGNTFDKAHKLGTLGYQTFNEVSYWGGESGKPEFDLGNYVVFLTLPGQTVPIFQSASVNFGFSTEYVLTLRTTAGANSGNIEVDIVANSSSIIAYPDLNQTAQFRIYNSLEEGQALQVKLEGINGNVSSTQVAAKSLSNFVDLGFGDYGLFANVEGDSSMSFNNRFVTLNQGESKAIVIYANENDKLSAMSFNESTLPQVYDFQIQVVNLVNDFSSIDLYFVRSGETLDNAKYHVSSLNFAKNKQISLPSDDYQVVVLVEQEDGKLLLDRLESVEFMSGTNNIIAVEKDDSAPTGYKIRRLY